VKLDAFLPRSSSVFVFIIAMASYDCAVTSLTVVLIHLLPLSAAPPAFWMSGGEPLAYVIKLVAFTPLIETAIFVSVIEVTRWMGAPTWLQLVVGTIVGAGPHSFLWGPHSLIVGPSFLIQAAAYVCWRGTSRKQAFGVVASIHAFHNLIPAIGLLAYDAPQA
jgi:hypothetical protein